MSLLKNSLIFILLSVLLHAADVVEYTTANGYINWTNGKVYAVGYGVVNPKLPKSMGLYGARRAAIVDARRNLLEAIGGVRIDSFTKIENGLLKKDIIKATVEGVVKNASIIKIEEKGDFVKAIVKAPINGSILNVVYPFNDLNDIKALLKRKYQKIILSDKIASIDNDIIKNILERLERIEKKLFFNDEHKDNTITGVIIDARNTNFIPSLTPKIYQIRTNTPMYPDGVVDKDIITNSFVALFVNNLKDAVHHPKVGNNPLVLRALKTYGKWRDKLVLSNKSAKKFKQLLSSEALKNAHLVIVISQ